jgi:hypothetical protein
MSDTPARAEVTVRALGPERMAERSYGSGDAMKVDSPTRTPAACARNSSS